MKKQLITEVMNRMVSHLDNRQIETLKSVLIYCCTDYEITLDDGIKQETKIEDNNRYLLLFLASKRVEGCSEKTLNYYNATISKMLVAIDKTINHITTDDLRDYLANYQKEKRSSKVTIDNIRRILSSFFGWLEDEDSIVKSPVRRIHKVKQERLLKRFILMKNWS